MEIIRERIKWWSPWGERKFSRNARRRGAGKLPAHAQESERGSGEAVSVGRISMTNTGRNRRADADPICILSQQINGPACNAPTRDDVRVRTRYFPARNAPIGLERNGKRGRRLSCPANIFSISVSRIFSIEVFVEKLIRKTRDKKAYFTHFSFLYSTCSTFIAIIKYDYLLFHSLLGARVNFSIVSFSKTVEKNSGRGRT